MCVEVSGYECADSRVKVEVFLSFGQAECAVAAFVPSVSSRLMWEYEVVSAVKETFLAGSFLLSESAVFCQVVFVVAERVGDAGNLAVMGRCSV